MFEQDNLKNKFLETVGWVRTLQDSSVDHLDALKSEREDGKKNLGGLYLKVGTWRSENSSAGSDTADSKCGINTDASYLIGSEAGSRPETRKGHQRMAFA